MIHSTFSGLAPHQSFIKSSIYIIFPSFPFLPLLKKLLIHINYEISMPKVYLLLLIKQNIVPRNQTANKHIFLAGV